MKDQRPLLNIYFSCKSGDIEKGLLMALQRIYFLLQDHS